MICKAEATGLESVDGTIDLDPQDSGKSNTEPSFNFRYAPKLKGYIYNLNQEPELAPGSYILYFTVDGSLYEYSAPILLK